MQHAFSVRLHSMEADVEPFGDILAFQALRHQAEDFEFPFRKLTGFFKIICHFLVLLLV